MPPQIHQAGTQELDTVTDVLQEAAAWLEQKGIPLWKTNELSPTRLATDVAAGLFFIAESDGEAAGVIMFLLEDREFWPDIPQEESAFLHRLAIRRKFAGRGIATALLQWAALRTREIGRKSLRLDCWAARTKLRRIYEGFGFHHHSDRQVGPYFVSRYQYDVSKLGGVRT